MKSQHANSSSLMVRTHLRAGGLCNNWDTNCAAVMPDGTLAINSIKNKPVWNNCDAGQLYAGKWCNETLNHDGAPAGAKCIQC
jgi:hypothetical protein